MKVIHYSLFVTIIVLSAFFIQMVQPQILGLGASTVVEQNEIQNVIHAYFDARYRTMSSLQLEDLSQLIDNSTQGATFLQTEAAKLELQIKHAKINKLGYTQYKIILDFKNIVFSSPQSAIISDLKVMM